LRAQRTSGSDETRNRRRRTGHGLVAVAVGAVTVAGAAGVAQAATFAQTSITPANNSTIRDSRPTITATYSDTLSTASTITVSKGTSAVDCPKIVSGSNISCTPSSLLPAGAYTIAVHAIQATGSTQAVDNTSTFTVDVPTMTSSAPAASTTVATLPNGGVVATYNEAIDDPHSVIHVQQVAELDGTPSVHTPLTGTTDYPDETSTVPGDSNTRLNNATQIRFTPDSTSLASGIYQVSLDVFGVTAGLTGMANTYAPKAESATSFTFTVDSTPPATPTDLSAPTITQTNATAEPFTGTGRPGNTITISVTDGTNTVSSDNAPVTVPDCPQAPTCPWKVTFDVHSLSDTTTGHWVATAHNAAGTAAAPPQAIVKDTTPPANPTVAATLAAGTTALHVSGSDADATVDHYTLTASDAHSHVAGPFDLTREGGNINANGSYTGDLDVSALDDGTLTVTVMPYDQYGNKPITGATTTVTKNVGVSPVFDQSAFVIGNPATNVSFETTLPRHNHAVQLPTRIEIEFNNPITLARHDTGTIQPQDLSAPSSYFVDNDGRGNRFDVTAAVDTHDNRKLVLTPPAGLTDGAYTMHVSVYEGNNACDFNSDPIGGSGPSPCPEYDNYIYVPFTSAIFDFSVDTHGPAAPTNIAVSPATVTAATVDSAVVSGSAEPYSQVTLSIGSTNGQLRPNAGQPVPVGSDGTWSVQVAGLATLADGPLSVSATPQDDAGNVGPAAVNAAAGLLSARPSPPRSLAVTAGATSFVLSWQPPSYDGYTSPPSRLTGYSLTYQDTTSGAADTTSHTVNLDANATSAEVSGVVSGDTYAVTLCAHNGLDGPCNAASMTVRPRSVTALSGAMSRWYVTYGYSVVLSGRLVRTDTGAGVAGATVRITPRYDDRSAGSATYVTTDSTGHWSLSLGRPLHDAVYRLYFAGDSSFAASTASAVLRVAEYVHTDRVYARSSSHRYPVTVSGHVAPSHPYRYVYVYGRVAGANHYQRLASVRLSSHSTWAWTHSFPRGTYYLYVRFLAQDGNQAGTSPSVRFSRS
jgi:large repetitive protein